MTHFVIVYKRSTGRVLNMEEFSDADRESGLAARTKLEVQYREDKDVEVVMLTASSFEELKKTHSRYFRTGRELFFDEIKKAFRLRPFPPAVRRHS